MMTFCSARTIFGAFSRQSFLMKNSLSQVNHRFALIHNSKLLWATHPIEIKMPSLSPTMTEGTIVKWIKKEGDTIEPGDVLCEIQTDKAVVGLETEEEGVLEKIIIPEDTKNVQLGEIIAIIRAEGEASETQPVSTIVETSKTEMCEKTEVVSKDTKDDSSKLMGPAVKKLMEEYNIYLTDISGSGPRHNLLKGDVLRYIKEHNLRPAPKQTGKVKPKKSESPKPSPKGTHVDIPVSSSTYTIAQEMIQSKKVIPHGYMSVDCVIDKVLDYTKKYERDGIKVTLNEFLVKSAISALKRVPKMKSIRQGGQLKVVDSINIAVTNINEGKFETSIIKNAENLTIKSLSEQIKSSRVNEINTESTQNMFRISNLSSFGISEYTEVISPTDVAIIAVGGVYYSFENDKAVRKLKVTLSFDNYLIGETEACEFLETFKLCLENPVNIMCVG